MVTFCFLEEICARKEERGEGNIRGTIRGG